MLKKELQIEFATRKENSVAYEHFLRMLGMVPIIEVKQDDSGLITSFDQIKKILQERFGEQINDNLFDELLRIFQEKNLCQLFNTAEMRFAYRMHLEQTGYKDKTQYDLSFVKKYQELFKEIRGEMEKIRKDHPDNPFLQYAILFCGIQEIMLAEDLKYLPYYQKMSKYMLKDFPNIQELHTHQFLLAVDNKSQSKVVNFYMNSCTEVYRESTYLWRKEALLNWNLAPNCIKIYERLGDDFGKLFTYYAYSYRERNKDREVKFREDIRAGIGTALITGNYLPYIVGEIFAKAKIDWDIVIKVRSSMEIEKEMLFLYGENYEVFTRNLFSPKLF